MVNRSNRLKIRYCPALGKERKDRQKSHLARQSAALLSVEGGTRCQCSSRVMCVGVSVRMFERRPKFAPALLARSNNS